MPFIISHHIRRGSTRLLNFYPQLLNKLLIKKHIVYVINASFAFIDGQCGDHSIKIFTINFDPPGGKLIIRKSQVEQSGCLQLTGWNPLLVSLPLSPSDFDKKGGH